MIFLVLFFKTRQPIEPVSFIQRICQDAASGIPQKLCRFVKRLTPITAIEKATEKGLDDVARLVLAPHFHGPDQQGKKVLFAFRVSVWRLMKRNATVWLKQPSKRTPLTWTMASLQFEHRYATIESSIEIMSLKQSPLLLELATRLTSLGTIY